MSDLQRAWAKAKLGLAHDPLGELAEEAGVETEGEPREKEVLPELPEHVDDDSSSASSMSSTGTIIPTPSQKLFARPEG